MRSDDGRRHSRRAQWLKIALGGARDRRHFFAVGDPHTSPTHEARRRTLLGRQLGAGPSVPNGKERNGMISRFLSRLRGPDPEPPAVAFARRAGGALEWWLIGFGSPGTAVATDIRILEAAMGLHQEGRSVRYAAAHLANVVAADLILSHSPATRAETLAHIRDPDVNTQLLNMRSSDVAMLADNINGFATDDRRLTSALRPTMYSQVLTRIAAPSLTPEAHALFAAVKHLWERSIVALELEPDNADLRYGLQRLISETIFALEGCDRETRERRHFDAVLEDTLLKQQHAAESADA